MSTKQTSTIWCILRMRSFSSAACIQSCSYLPCLTLPWGVVRKRYDQCVYQGFYNSFQSAKKISNSRNYSLKLPSVKFLFQSCSAFSRTLPTRYTVQKIQLHRKGCIQDLKQDTSISPYNLTRITENILNPESQCCHPASVPLCILQFPLLLIITLLISVFSLSRDPWPLRIQRTISLNLAVLGAAGLNLVL